MIASNPYDRALDARPTDAWATITITVAAIVLSVMRFQGSALDFLGSHWIGKPLDGWRLGTSTLLHVNYLHLAFNCFWMMRLGSMLESIVRPVTFFWLLLVLAFGPVAAEFAVGDGGIGLSGLVYGLWGALWAIDRWHPAGRGVVHSKLNEMFVAWFFLCIILSYYDILPIANVAHGMGAVLGGLFGWAVSKPRGQRLVPALAAPGVALLWIALALFARSQVNIWGHDWSPLRVQSIELFEQALSLNERARQAKQRGGTDDAMRLYARARDRYRASIDVHELPEAWWNLGICLEQLGERGDAEAAYARARELNPDLGKR